ncbi:MAG: hypothetical protein ACKPB8_13215 [Alphaproteobacteria bacterium]
MHDIAENGVAAHWSYKQGPGSSRDQKRYPWVRDLFDAIFNGNARHEGSKDKRGARRGPGARLNRL